MIDTQLGRRNLTPIQKIAITEKYRKIYEEKAKENMNAGINQHKQICQTPLLILAQNLLNLQELVSAHMEEKYFLKSS